MVFYSNLIRSFSAYFFTEAVGEGQKEEEEELWSPAVLMVFVLTRGPVIIYLALRVIRATSVPPWLMFMAAIGALGL